MKVTLICPTNYYGASATRQIYYPMGILLIGSLLKDTHPSWEIQVLDGENYSLEDIKEKILGSDVLGLSANTNNYPYCLELAKFAKDYGADKVVLGGPHASAVAYHQEEKISLAEIILKKRREIDAVIVGDGEEAFLKYLEKNSGNYHGIENLVWREEGKIISNTKKVPSAAPRFIDLDYSLLSLKSYWEEHKKEFPQMNQKFIEGFTHVGCKWREKIGCLFCDIPYPRYQAQPAGRFWRDLLQAHQQLGINAFKDYGDSLTADKERLKALLESRPSSLEMLDFAAYGRSSEITSEIADLLKDLNVKYLYVGYDSGDNQMLKNLREGYSVKSNYLATERLAERGIKIIGSLILGAPGESKKTMKQTELFAKEILNYGNVTQLYCAALNIFPGASLSQMFLEAYPQFVVDDLWDVTRNTQLWMENFCQASYLEIMKKAEEINALNPSKRNRYFGLKSD